MKNKIITIVIDKECGITAMLQDGTYKEGKKAISDLFDFLESEGITLTDQGEVESHVPDDAVHNVLHQIDGIHNH